MTGTGAWRLIPVHTSFVAWDFDPHDGGARSMPSQKFLKSLTNWANDGAGCPA
jgi:hypothetical protein